MVHSLPESTEELWGFVVGEISFGSLEAMAKEGRIREAADLFEEHWIELWYADDLVLLGELVTEFATLPGRHGPGTEFVRVALGLDGQQAMRNPGENPARTSGQPGGDEERLLAQLLAAHQFRASGQFQRARMLAEDTLPFLERLEQSGGGRTRLGTFLRIQCGAMALMAGDLTGARDHFRSALDGAAVVGAAQQAHAAALLALVLAVSGEVRDAETLLTRIDQAAGAIGRARMADDAVEITRLVQALDHGELVAANRIVRARPPASYGELWPLALWAHAQYLLLTGRHRHGLRLVEQAEALSPPGLPGDGLPREIVRAVRADFNVALGDLREAWVAVEPGTPRGSWTAVAEVTVLYVSGEFQAARYAARAARVSHDLTARETVKIRAMEAAASLSHGDTLATAELVGELSRLAEAHGWTSYRAALPAALLTAESVALGAAESSRPSEEGLGPWIPEPVLTSPLSPREQGVLRLLVLGTPRAVIAKELGVSVNTIKTQIRSIYSKLRVRGRAEMLTKVSLMPPAWTYDLPRAGDAPEQRRAVAPGR